MMGYVVAFEAGCYEGTHVASCFVLCFGIWLMWLGFCFVGVPVEIFVQVGAMG
jgi:hypothetical protein